MISGVPPELSEFLKMAIPLSISMSDLNVIQRTQPTNAGRREIDRMEGATEKIKV